MQRPRVRPIRSLVFVPGSDEKRLADVPGTGDVQAVAITFTVELRSSLELADTGVSEGHLSVPVIMGLEPMLLTSLLTESRASLRHAGTP